MALALSLPAALGESRQLVQVMAFGVVLFTLMMQSMTMRPLLNRLGILERNPLRTRDGAIPEDVFEKLVSEVDAALTTEGAMRWLPTSR